MIVKVISILLKNHVWMASGPGALAVCMLRSSFLTPSSPIGMYAMLLLALILTFGITALLIRVKTELNWSTTAEPQLLIGQRM